MFVCLSVSCQQYTNVDPKNIQHCASSLILLQKCPPTYQNMSNPRVASQSKSWSSSTQRMAPQSTKTFVPNNLPRSSSVLRASCPFCQTKSNAGPDCLLKNHITFAIFFLPTLMHPASTPPPKFIHTKNAAFCCDHRRELVLQPASDLWQSPPVQFAECGILYTPIFSSLVPARLISSNGRTRQALSPLNHHFHHNGQFLALSWLGRFHVRTKTRSSPRSPLVILVSSSR